MRSPADGRAPLNRVRARADHRQVEQLLSAFLNIVFTAAAGAVGSFRGTRRGGRHLPRPVVRAPWWKWAAATGLVAQNLPLLVGAWWLLRMAMEMARDDFLLFIGMILAVAALGLCAIVLSIVAWSVALAMHTVRDHGHARWFVAGFGVFGSIITAQVLFSAPPPYHPLFVLYALASALNLGLASYAPLRTPVPA